MKKMSKIFTFIALGACSFSMIIFFNQGYFDAFMGYLNAVIWILLSLIHENNIKKLNNKIEVIEELTKITDNNEELGSKIKELFNN